MAKLLGIYKDDYKNIIYDSKNDSNMSEIYTAFNIKTNKECCLKVINKEKLKAQDYIYFLERLKKEEELQTLCNSENTVNFYRKLETEENIIFELEYCEDNLYNYLQENIQLSKNKNFFKKIIVSIAKALKTLYDKGIMHRDIKPHNIYIKNSDDEENSDIKLGDFGCAIKINENPSDSIGTYFYNAPEMIKDLEYDEKVDLWSLGVTLVELYFGAVPYCPDSDIHSMMNDIYEENLILPKTFKKNEQPKIPSLDILFKRLLTINPEDRMTHKEFFDYVFSDDFMKENIICVNNNQKYQKIFDDILNEDFIEFEFKVTKEAKPTQAQQEKIDHEQLNSIVKGGNLPDIMNFSNASANNDNKFNNIIYYDANTNYMSHIIEASDYFEKQTPGAFILCTNMDSFALIREEILTEIKNDDRTTFNLITSGSQCDNVMKFLDENPQFKSIIKNACVFCQNVEKWSPLKNKYNIIYDVSREPKSVVEFIKHFSLEEIKPYRVIKLITLKDYLKKYKDRHFKISQFYGDLTPETYKENIKKMKSLIEEEKKEDKLYNKDQNKLLESFLTFDLTKDLKILDKLIIKEYTNNTFYGDLNKWLMNTNFNSYDVVA